MNTKPYIVIPVGAAIRLILLTALVVALVILVVSSDGDPETVKAVGAAAFLS